MLSVEQSYSRLFRPWDVSNDKVNSSPSETTVIDKVTEIKDKKRKADEVRRENRLRKIRGTFKKTEANIHQDATVSTTTTDSEEDKTNKLGKIDIPSDSPVASLSLCCDRLLQEPEKDREKTEKINTTKLESQPILTTVNSFSPTMLPHLYSPHSVPEYLPPMELAQALGVPATDPLLLESLAQGYAMELEYARILHQENEAKLLNARKQRPKKYKCPHCHVGFSNNGQLKGHVRIHTGERPFKCDEKNCGKTFTRNEELTRHKRIHSGVRPFPCTTCGKKFGRRDHLKKHTRTHFVQAERMMPVFLPLSAMPHVGGFPYLYGY